MKKKMIIAGIAVTHFVLSIMAMAYWVAESYNKRTIGYVPPETNGAVQIVSRILFSPMALVTRSFEDNTALLLALAANSLFWGLALYYLGATLINKLKKRIKTY